MLKTKYLRPLVAALIVSLFASFVATLSACGSGEVSKTSNRTSPPSSGLPSSLQSTPVINKGLTHWPYLPIPMLIDAGMNAQESSAIRAAMATWEWATGLTLFRYDGPGTIIDRSVAGFKGVLAAGHNGAYILDDWSATGKPRQVLATTEYDTAGVDGLSLQHANIFFNRRDYQWIDSMSLTTAVSDTETVALHELGHFLGLTHVASGVDPDSIMNPAISVGRGLSHRRLDRGDIERIQAIYGCAGLACDIGALLATRPFNALGSGRASNP